MVTDFDTFLRSILPSSTPRALTTVANPSPAMLQEGSQFGRFAAAPTGTPSPSLPDFAPMAGRSVGQQLPTSNSIRRFQQEVQAPPASQPGEQPVVYQGSYQTVTGNYGGVQYTILMPIERTEQLPDGWSLVGAPIVNDPARVHRAEEAGSAGQQGQSQIGLLSQMPPEIQATFPSANKAEMIEGQKVEAGVSEPPQAFNYPAVQGAVQQYPATTTDAIRQSDPELADLLESNGITTLQAGDIPIVTEDGSSSWSAPTNMRSSSRHKRRRGRRRRLSSMSLTPSPIPQNSRAQAVYLH